MLTNSIKTRILKSIALLALASGAILLSSCHRHHNDAGGHHGHGHGVAHGNFNHHNHQSSGYRRASYGGSRGRGYGGGAYCPTY